MTQISDERQTDRELSDMIQSLLNHGEAGYTYVKIDAHLSALRELQSLRASIPGGVGVKGLKWSQGWGERRASTPFGDYRLSANTSGAFDWHSPDGGNYWASTEDKAKAAAQADYERRILSALDLAPAEGEPVGLFRKTDGAWKQVPDEWADHPNVQPLYATPSNPVISDDLVHAAQFLIERLDDFENGSLGDSIEDACRDFDGHISPAIERLRAALSVKPQSGGDQP